MRNSPPPNPLLHFDALSGVDIDINININNAPAKDPVIADSHNKTIGLAMALLRTVCERASFVPLHRPLEIRKVAPLRWLQRFHTSQQYFSREDEDGLEGSSTTKRGIEQAIHAVNGRRRWSASDKSLLDQMRKEERSIDDMSKALGRSRTSITQMLARFSQSDDNRILDAQQEGLTWQQLSEQMPLHTMRQVRRRWNTLKNGKNSWTLKRFSHEEDEQLKELRGQSLRWTEIARVMSGRTKQSLRIRYEMIVPEFERVDVRNLRWWSEDDIRKLHTMENESSVHVANVLGKTSSYVLLMRRRLATGGNYAKAKHWTSRECQLCRELAAGGQNALEIASRMNRSLESVRGRLNRMAEDEKIVGSHA